MSEEVVKQGEKDSKGSPLDEAKDILNKIKEERKKNARILEETQRLHAEGLVSGSAEASSTKVEVKEETDKEYKDRIMRGEL